MMIKSLRNKIILLVALLCSALALFGISLSVKVAKAETPLVENGVATSGFTMQDGAGVRLTTGSSGIRFLTDVEQDFYNYLTNTYEGYEITFHTLIRPYQAGVTLTPDTQYVKDVVCATDVDFSTSATFTYRAALTYNNLEELNDATLMQQAYASEIDARAYVKLTKEGASDVIIYAKTGDVVRSMQSVANMALLKNDTLGDDDADKIKGEKLETLQNYIATPNRLTDQTVYVKGDTNTTFDIADVQDGTYNLYVNAKRVAKNVEVADGKLTLNGIDLGVDGYKTLSLINSANVYSMPITIASERVDMFSVLDGESFGDKTLSSLLTQHFGSATLSATQDGKALTVDNGVITGVTPSLVKDDNHVTGVNDVVISITDGATEKLFILQAYTKVINDMADMTETFVNEHKTAYDGYYIMSSNVDMNNMPDTFKHDPVENGYQLTGTFDGNGYKLYNVSLNVRGLFGYVSGGIIKNLAVDVKAANSGWASYVFGESARDNAIIENVYVNVSSSASNSIRCGTLFNSIDGTAKFNNVIINTNSVYYNADTSASFAKNLKAENLELYNQNITNVYVMSNYELGNTLEKIGDVDTSKAVFDASNIKTGANYTLNGVKRYTSVAEFKADDTNNFASFNNSFWDTITGIPVFSSEIDYTLTVNDGAESASIAKNDQDGLTLNVKVEGIEIDNATFTIVDGAEFVEVRDGKIYPLAVGSATVKASITACGVEVSDTITIIVTKPESNYGTTVDMFSAYDGESYGDKTFAQVVEELFPGETVTIKQNGTLLSYENGILTGVTPNFITNATGHKTGVNDIVISVEGATEIVNITVKAYTRVINEITDLTLIEGQSMEVKEGYYILQNDINADGVTIGGSVDNGDVSFKGTLDGNGHTISNVKVGAQGLLGYLNSTAIVKDLALVNVTANGSWARVAIAFIVNAGATVSDVYVSASDNRVINAGGVFGNISAGANISNVIFEANVSASDTVYGSFVTSVSGGLDNLDEANETINNVYVISSNELSVTSSYTIDASNTDATNKFTGVKRYKSIANFKADSTNKFSSFNSKCWDMTTGIPVWNTEIDYTLLINEGAESIELPIDNTDGIKLDVTVDGVAINNATLSIIDGAEFVEIADGFIRPLALGDATIKASITVFGKEYSDTIIVSVSKPVINYATTIELFSVADGVSYGDKTFAQVIEELFVDETVTIHQGETQLSYDSGVVTGVTPSFILDEVSRKTGVNTVILTVEGSSKIVNVPVKAYTKVINDMADMTGTFVNDKTVKQDGYYIMSQNVDMDNTPDTFKHDPVASGYHLTGTFDGNGYKIYNLTLYTRGLFGYISGGVVKNLAVDVKAANSGWASWVFGENITGNGVLENIYVNISSSAGNSVRNGVLFSTISNTATINNVVINTNGATYTDGKSLCAKLVTTDIDKYNANITNVYVIAKYVLSYSGTETIDAKNQTGANYTLTGVNRYTSLADFTKATGNNYSSFDANYWDKTVTEANPNGMPIWKTA